MTDKVFSFVAFAYGQSPEVSSNVENDQVCSNRKVYQVHNCYLDFKLLYTLNNFGFEPNQFLQVKTLKQQMSLIKMHGVIESQSLI